MCSEITLTESERFVNTDRTVAPRGQTKGSLEWLLDSLQSANVGDL